MKRIFLFLVLSLIGLSAFAQPRYTCTISKGYSLDYQAQTPVNVLCFVFDISSGNAELAYEEDFILTPYSIRKVIEVVGYGEYYLQIVYYHCTEDGIQLSDPIVVPNLVYLKEDESNSIMLDIHIGIVNSRMGLPTKYDLRQCVIIPKSEYEKYGID